MSLVSLANQRWPVKYPDKTVQDSEAPPNEASQLTKRGANTVGRAASRPSVIESRFAAERRCSADLRGGARWGSRYAGFAR